MHEHGPICERREASGGLVPKRAPGLTINVIAGGSAKPDMPPAPPPMPMPPPPAPPMGPPPGAPGGTPPIVGNAALGKPAFAKGGRVKSPVPDLPTVPMGGAGSAYARLRMQKRGGK